MAERWVRVESEGELRAGLMVRVDGRAAACGNAGIYLLQKRRPSGEWGVTVVFGCCAHGAAFPPDVLKASACVRDGILERLSDDPASETTDTARELEREGTR